MSLRPHLTATFLLGLPLVGTHVSRMLIGVTDTVLIGRYGVDELAALVLATSCFFILVMLGSGYALGVMGVIASARARGDAVLWVDAAAAAAAAGHLLRRSAIGGDERCHRHGAEPDKGSEG